MSIRNLRSPPLYFNIDNLLDCNENEDAVLILLDAGNYKALKYLLFNRLYSRNQFREDVRAKLYPYKREWLGVGDSELKWKSRWRDADGKREDRNPDVDIRYKRQSLIDEFIRNFEEQIFNVATASDIITAMNRIGDGLFRQEQTNQVDSTGAFIKKDIGKVFTNTVEFNSTDVDGKDIILERDESAFIHYDNRTDTSIIPNKKRRTIADLQSVFIDGYQSEQSDGSFLTIPPLIDSILLASQIHPSELLTYEQFLTELKGDIFTYYPWIFTILNHDWATHKETLRMSLQNWLLFLIDESHKSIADHSSQVKAKAQSMTAFSLSDHEANDWNSFQLDVGLKVLSNPISAGWDWLFGADHPKNTIAYIMNESALIQNEHLLNIFDALSAANSLDTAQNEHLKRIANSLYNNKGAERSIADLLSVSVDGYTYTHGGKTVNVPSLQECVLMSGGIHPLQLLTFDEFEDVLSTDVKKYYPWVFQILKSWANQPPALTMTVRNWFKYLMEQASDDIMEKAAQVQAKSQAIAAYSLTDHESQTDDWASFQREVGLKTTFNPFVAGWEWIFGTDHPKETLVHILDRDTTNLQNNLQRIGDGLHRQKVTTDVDGNTVTADVGKIFAERVNDVDHSVFVYSNGANESVAQQQHQTNNKLLHIAYSLEQLSGIIPITNGVPSRPSGEINGISSAIGNIAFPDSFTVSVEGLITAIESIDPSADIQGLITAIESIDPSADIQGLITAIESIESTDISGLITAIESIESTDISGLITAIQSIGTFPDSYTVSLAEAQELITAIESSTDIAGLITAIESIDPSADIQGLITAIQSIGTFPDSYTVSLTEAQALITAIESIDPSTDIQGLITAIQSIGTFPDSYTVSLTEAQALITAIESIDPITDIQGLITAIESIDSSTDIAGLITAIDGLSFVERTTLGQLRDKLIADAGETVAPIKALLTKMDSYFGEDVSVTLEEFEVIRHLISDSLQSAFFAAKIGLDGAEVFAEGAQATAEIIAVGDEVLDTGMELYGSAVESAGVAVETVDTLWNIIVGFTNIGDWITGYKQRETHHSKLMLKLDQISKAISGVDWSGNSNEMWSITIFGRTLEFANPFYNENYGKTDLKYDSLYKALSKTISYSLENMAGHIFTRNDDDVPTPPNQEDINGIASSIIETLTTVGDKLVSVGDDAPPNLYAQLGTIKEQIGLIETTFGTELDAIIGTKMESIFCALATISNKLALVTGSGNDTSQPTLYNQLRTIGDKLVSVARSGSGAPPNLYDQIGTIKEQMEAIEETFSTDFNQIDTAIDTVTEQLVEVETTLNTDLNQIDTTLVTIKEQIEAIDFSVDFAQLDTTLATKMEAIFCALATISNKLAFVTSGGNDDSKPTLYNQLTTVQEHLEETANVLDKIQQIHGDVS